MPKDPDGKSYHVNWRLINLLFSLQWLIDIVASKMLVFNSTGVL